MEFRNPIASNLTDNQPDEQILGRDGFVLAAQRIAELTQHLTGVVNNIQAVRASAEGPKPFDDFGYYAYGQKPLNDLGYFEAGGDPAREPRPHSPANIRDAR